MTDCCTHAIELCFRYLNPLSTLFPAHTYVCIPQTMRKLGIDYQYTDYNWYDQGEYQFQDTIVWDSARRLGQQMYRPGMMQCLSFGASKPLPIGHGGAILLDDPAAYQALICMRYDGRDVYNYLPWETQPEFKIGYHYRPTFEDAIRGIELLSSYQDQGPSRHEYPDLRKIIFK